MCAMQNIPASFHPARNENGTLAGTGREELKMTRRRVHQSPPGNPASARKKKITGAKITTAMTPSTGPARFLKNLPLFFAFIVFFAFRLIVENMRCTKMVSRGTLDALAYFRLACRVLVLLASRLLLRVPLPVLLARSFLRSLFCRERKMTGMDECRGGGFVEGPACLVLFLLLSFLSLDFRPFTSASVSLFYSGTFRKKGEETI